MSRYLITGGCGFIGTHLTKELEHLGHEVLIIDPKNKSSFSDKKLLSTLSSVDGCFHLGAIASVPLSIKEVYRSHCVNASLTVKLIDFIKQLKTPIPVVFTSSAAVYGQLTSFPLTEKLFTDVLSPYAIDKRCSEMYLKNASLLFSIPTVSFRLFNVYGPGQDPSSSYSGVISLFIAAIKNKKSLTLYGDGQQNRDFIYVSDVVHGLILGMQALHKKTCSGEVFNLCSSKPTSLLELLKLLERIYSSNPKIEKKPSRKGDILHSYGSSAKALKMLGWSPKVELLEGLAQV